MNAIRETFIRSFPPTGDDVSPFPFQEKIAEELLSGCSIVLQAPTGAGKTRAALLPFFHSWRNDVQTDFPTKCVYVVPMRVLAKQFVDQAREMADLLEPVLRKKLNVRIQTGDQQEDRSFDGDLIFCTIDQFLSSYLTMPYSLSRRMANVNAGAMVGSYLVFDEFHLFDPDSTLSTTLYTLKQLCKVAPALVMTATFSATMLQTMADLIGAQAELVSTSEAHEIETRKGKYAPRQRLWRTADSLLTAEAVLATHCTRSLALCNRVRSAQALFRALRDSDERKRRGIELMLLHSRFLPEDRHNTEELLKLRFGKGNHDGNFIAIATQTIEVGVDVTSEVLHTELAPASALIQRAGRCARYPAEQGKVIVYPVETFAPYGKGKDEPSNDDTWSVEMRAAFDWVREHSGEVFDFEKEQALVNAVATPRDQLVLQGIAAGAVSRKEAIHRVLLGERQDGDTRLLVRDADSKHVVVHLDPNALLADPYGTVKFSIPTVSLYGMVNDWLKRDASEELDFRVMYLCEADSKDDDNRTEYGWKELLNTQLLTQTRMIAVHPALAGYLKDEGFVGDRGNTGFVSRLLPRTEQERVRQGQRYSLETYEEHIRLVLKAFEEVALPELSRSAQLLEQAAGWPAGIMLRAAWLACVLHDVGKLADGWQQWAHAYQRLIGMPVDTDFAIAHSEYDEQNSKHEAAQKKVKAKHTKPPHAAESAMAAYPMIKTALGEEMLWKAVVLAISRHHTAFVNECKPFVLTANAAQHIQKTLALLNDSMAEGLDVSRVLKQVPVGWSGFGSYATNPDKVWGWLAYTLIVRALRRADQQGTVWGIKV